MYMKNTGNSDLRIAKAGRVLGQCISSWPCFLHTFCFFLLLETRYTVKLPVDLTLRLELWSPSVQPEWLLSDGESLLLQYQQLDWQQE